MTLQNSSSKPNQKRYGQRNVDDYVQLFNPNIAQKFDPQSWQEIRRVLDLAIPKPAPKIIDLRFNVDLLISRFYIVLFVGKDRRRKSRSHEVERLSTRIGNWIAAIILIVAINLIVSTLILIVAYLLKSFIGIDLMPGHFPDRLKEILS